MKSILCDQLSLTKSGKDEEFDKSNNSGVGLENTASDSRGNVWSTWLKTPPRGIRRVCFPLQNPGDRNSAATQNGCFILCFANTTFISKQLGPSSYRRLSCVWLQTFTASTDALLCSSKSNRRISNALCPSQSRCTESLEVTAHTPVQPWRLDIQLCNGPRQTHTTTHPELNKFSSRS